MTSCVSIITIGQWYLLITFEHLIFGVSMGYLWSVISITYLWPEIFGVSMGYLWSVISITYLWPGISGVWGCGFLGWFPACTDQSLWSSPPACCPGLCTESGAGQAVYCPGHLLNKSKECTQTKSYLRMMQSPIVSLQVATCVVIAMYRQNKQAQITEELTTRNHNFRQIEKSSKCCIGGKGK